MAVPTQPNNIAKVMRATEYLLGRINAANDFRTDGLLVIRGQDPRGYIQDHQDIWANKMRAIAIMPGAEVIDPKRVGGVRRYSHTYVLWGLINVTDQDDHGDRRMDDIVSDLVDDLKRALDPDQKIKAAAVALGYAEPSCMNHHVAAVRTDEGTQWPFCEFTATVQFEYDRATNLT